MSTFHDFLVWFDGWSENIEGQPTAKQWDRLRAKVGEVRAVEPENLPTVYAGPAPAPQPTAELVVKNEMQWQSVFMGALCEMGYDPESAREMFASYKGERETIDITANAAAAARTMHAADAN